METLAICNPIIRDIYPNNLYYNFILCGENINIGLLDIEVKNEERLTEYAVSVQVNAFSCNYRDKAIMLEFNDRCNMLSKNSRYFYSPFGSDFVATVLNIGKKVKSLKIGDRVIPNNAYPYRNDGSYGGIITNYASQRFQIFNEDQLISIPNNLTDEIAASFSVAAQTAYSMIRKANLQKGMNVLVTAGSSNTSLAIINALQQYDVCIWVVSSDVEFTAKHPMGEKLILIPKQYLSKKQLKDFIGETLFDVIFDPFFDIHLSYLIPRINYNGKYITCGLYSQHSLYKEDNWVKSQNYMFSLSEAISRNVSIIGNCIGVTMDLQKAILDYTNGNFAIIIDSIHNHNSVNEFLRKSFHGIPRFGKVVYKYDNN